MGGKNSQSAIVGALAGSVVLSTVLAGLGVAAGVGALAKVTPVMPEPLVWLFGGNAVVYGLAALLLALVPLFLAKKVTDPEKVKRMFGLSGNVLIVIAIWETLVGLGAILLSLFSINAFDGMEGLQKPIWLGAFIPPMIMAACAGVTGWLMRQIADGRTNLINALKAAVLVMAGAALVVVSIATVMALHPKKGGSTTTRPSVDYSDILDLLN
jgi:hypothetical protein